MLEKRIEHTFLPPVMKLYPVRTFEEQNLQMGYETCVRQKQERWLYLNRLYEQKAVMVLYGFDDRLTERMEGGGGQSGTVSHGIGHVHGYPSGWVGIKDKRRDSNGYREAEKKPRRSGSLVPVELHVLCTTAMFDCFSNSSVQESRCNSSPRRSNKGQILSLSHI